MGTNLLTGHTDRHWKAVRKGVAPAFSAQHMRCGPCTCLLQPRCASHWMCAAVDALLHKVIAVPVCVHDML